VKDLKAFYILVNSSELEDFEILVFVDDLPVTFTQVEDGGSKLGTRIRMKSELVVF
jgi:hypothetical protein